MVILTLILEVIVFGVINWLVLDSINSPKMSKKSALWTIAAVDIWVVTGICIGIVTGAGYLG